MLAPFPGNVVHVLAMARPYLAVPSRGEEPIVPRVEMRLTHRTSMPGRPLLAIAVLCLVVWAVFIYGVIRLL
jgi:hypothetical protein